MDGASARGPARTALPRHAQRMGRGALVSRGGRVGQVLVTDQAAPAEVGSAPAASDRELLEAAGANGQRGGRGPGSGWLESQGQPPSLHAAGRAVLWSAVQQWGRRLIGALTFLVLARLLDPLAFGVVAIAALALDFVHMFVTQGLPSALIQRKELSPSHLDSAFWLSMTTATVLAAATFVFRRPLATALGDASAAEILGVLTLGLPLAALGIVPTAILTRTLAFRTLAVRSAVGGLAGGLLGIGTALWGVGPWALVFQALGGAACAVAALWGSVAWRPGLRVTGKALRDLLGFSLGVLGNHILWVVSQRVDQALIGRFLGPYSLGLYAMAKRLPSLGAEVVAGPLSNVALPAFARLQTDPQRLAAAFTRSTVLVAAVAAPVFVGAAMAAPVLVPLLLGPNWVPAVPILQAFCLPHSVAVALVFVHPAFLALGRPTSYSAIYILLLGGSAASAFAAAGHGIEALAWSIAIVHALVSVAALGLLRIYLPFSFAAFGKALGPIGIASGALAVTQAGLDRLLATRAPDLLLLTAEGFTGTVAYAGTLLLLSPSLAADVGRHLRSLVTSILVAPTPDRAAATRPAASHRDGHAGTTPP